MMNRAFLAVLLAASCRPAAAQTGAVARSLQEDFIQVAQTAKLSVVNIATIQEQEYQVVSPPFFFGDPDEAFDFYGSPRSRVYKHRTAGVGSGFIVDSKGHVLTNDHVVRDATEIRVTLTLPGGKEETLPGKVVGRDSNLDLAVVQIQADRAFPFLRLADSDKVRVGEWAIAIGSPFALQQTVTAGIISAVRQSLNIEGRPLHNMLQTDAAINQGNSGGPLLNLKGEVVGVNTAIYSPSGASAGIGFAIPSNEVKLSLEYLVAGRQRKSGWLGVEVAPIDDVLSRRFGLPEPTGALVNSTVPGGPAARSGLQRGDVIWRAGGAEIQSPQDLVARITRLSPGDEIQLEVFRAGRKLPIKLRVGERPQAAEQEPRAARPRAGKEEPSQGARSFNWEGVYFEPVPGQGVKVARIDGDSPLRGTLQEGDLIRGVDGAETRDLRSFQAALGRLQLSEGAVFDILRRGRPMYLSVRTG